MSLRVGALGAVRAIVFRVNRSAIPTFCYPLSRYSCRYHTCSHLRRPEQSRAAQDAFIARILDGRFEGDWQTWV